MNTLIGALAALVLVVALIFGLSLLMAYPTMRLVNAIFAPSFLTFVFGAPKIAFWTAWFLNMLVGGLRTATSSSSKKD